SPEAETPASGTVFDYRDPPGGLVTSVPAFSSEMAGREKDDSPFRTERISARIQALSISDACNNSTAKSLKRGPEVKIHTADYGDSQENVESADDIWLSVSEVPLLTQPTAAPPPSRGPPPRPAQLSKTASGSASSHFEKLSDSYPTCSNSNEAFQSPRSVPSGAKSSSLEDFSASKRRNRVQGSSDALSGKAMDASSVAASSDPAMREAMDKTVDESKHVKEARRRKNAQEEKRQREEEESRRIREAERKEQEQRKLEREKESGSRAVKMVIREAHERAVDEAPAAAKRAAVAKAEAEAQERAERAAVKRVQAEVRERARRNAKEEARKAAIEANERARAQGREKEAQERTAAAAREKKHNNDDNLESFGMGFHASGTPMLREISLGIAEMLDIEIRRWAAGKKGNLRALLSTLQDVLWPECGWQPVPLTELMAAASVKKAYRKANLCIHPDKMQQKGATLQQKYIAEKVLDILQDALNKFNSEDHFKG
ncbi:Auxilin-related protein, partial [Drosera capensis]